MRKRALIFLCLSVLLILNSCGTSSTAQPYTSMHTVTAISAKVAAHYGETSPTITKMSATLTDGARAVPMNLVALDGHFHKGSLVATHLSFSMLADGIYIWAILATDNQHTQVWFDHELDVKL